MIDFDGVNDWIDLRAGGPVLNVVNSASGGTITGWFEFDDTTTVFMMSYAINNGGTPTDISRIALQLNATSQLEANARAGDADAVENQTDGDAAIALATLIHLAVVVNVGGDTMTFYRNGVQTANLGVSFAGATFTATGCSAAAIAAQDDGTSGFSNLRAEDCRVYNRALTANEIATIYACRGHDNIVDGLTARYQLQEGIPTATAAGAGTAKDVSDNQRHGTPTGGPVYLEFRTNRRKRFT